MIFKATIYYKEEFDENGKCPFRVAMTILAASKIIENPIIIDINPYKYENTPKEIRRAVTFTYENFANMNPLVIARISIDPYEFGEDRFYLYRKGISHKEMMGRIMLPVKEVLDRQRDILEDAGFSMVHQENPQIGDNFAVCTRNADGKNLLSELNKMNL